MQSQNINFHGLFMYHNKLFAVGRPLILCNSNFISGIPFKLPTQRDKFYNFDVSVFLSVYGIIPPGIEQFQFSLCCIKDELRVSWREAKEFNVAGCINCIHYY